TGLCSLCTHDYYDGLHFLSREEQECLQFFEKTIDSLEESVEEVDGRLTSSPSPSAILSTLQSRFHGSKDHDIIDLVRPQPDLVQSRVMDFDPTHPDLTFLTLYNNFGSTDSQALSYHPPGCIPTPVLIAQKIAETQPSGTTNLQPTSVHRCWSEEYEKSSSPSIDIPGKQAPPTSAKPTRYPANINVILGSKDQQSHSHSNVNLQERRSLMLANLTGSHPQLQEEANYTAEEKARSIPRRRSDPTPPESSSYRGKNPTVNPSTGLNHPPNLTTRSVKAPAPTPAPRPPRNSYHGQGLTQKPVQRALSPQYRRKPASMFPSQGVTVQFSGRGATEESRKDALRKLGLLKDP
uniref:Proline and serine rich 2 n=1 Tax=Takifugu rubripes TaxID=31033 RepID=A0A674MFN3_TAKRU